MPNESKLQIIETMKLKKKNNNAIVVCLFYYYYDFTESVKGNLYGWETLCMCVIFFLLPFDLWNNVLYYNYKINLNTLGVINSMYFYYFFQLFLVLVIIREEMQKKNNGVKSFRWFDDKLLFKVFAKEKILFFLLLFN